MRFDTINDSEQYIDELKICFHSLLMQEMSTKKICTSPQFVTS